MTTEKSVLQSGTEYPLVVVTSEMGRTGETGVQTHFNDFMAYLREQGHPVDFIGPDEARIAYPHLSLSNSVIGRLIPVWKEMAFSGLRWMTYYTTRREVKRRLRGRTQWCVYAQDPVTARAALSLRHMPGHRVVLAAHYNRSQAEEMANRGRLRRDDWLYRKIMRQELHVLKLVDQVIAFSAFMRREIQAAMGTAGSIIVIPNTAQTPVARRNAIPRDLIAIGTLEPRKNQAFLLRVLAAAKHRGFLYTLTLVGSGEEAERLKLLAKELDIADHTFFLGRQENAASLVSSHRLLVHAALVENLPIALIESLATGIPILAPFIGGIPEVYTEGIEGRFWDLEDIEGSAAILIEMLENEPGLARMGVAARERYLQHFSREQVFGAISQVLYGDGCNQP